MASNRSESKAYIGVSGALLHTVDHTWYSRTLFISDPDSTSLAIVPGQTCNDQ